MEQLWNLSFLKGLWSVEQLSLRTFSGFGYSESIHNNAHVPCIFKAATKTPRETAVHTHATKESIPHPNP